MRIDELQKQRKRKTTSLPCLSFPSSLSLVLFCFASAIRFGIRIQIHTDCGPMCRNAIELHEIEFAASCCRLAVTALPGLPQ